MVWYGMVWYGMLRYGMLWYSMLWYSMVCYAMLCYGSSSLKRCLHSDDSIVCLVKLTTWNKAISALTTLSKFISELTHRYVSGYWRHAVLLGTTLARTRLSSPSTHLKNLPENSWTPRILKIIQKSRETTSTFPMPGMAAKSALMTTYEVGISSQSSVNLGQRTGRCRFVLAPCRLFPRAPSFVSCAPPFISRALSSISRAPPFISRARRSFLAPCTI